MDSRFNGFEVHALSLRGVHGRQGDVLAGDVVGGIRLAGVLLGAVVDVVLGGAAAAFDVGAQLEVLLEPGREVLGGHAVTQLDIALNVRVVR